MTVRITNIQHFSLDDGPGIRTTVFLKGCPLRCVWCHNPESQNPFCEILSESDGTIQTAGRDCQVEAVMQEVLKDEVYYIQSGGGVTISGGEPVLQVDFLENLLKAAKNKDIHTCVETCGYAPSGDFEKIAPLVDCFLFDWKESDPEKHLAFTGVDNHLIRENLALLDRLGCEIILRLPLIPGYNDTREHLKGCAEIANKYWNNRRMKNATGKTLFIKVYLYSFMPDYSHITGLYVDGRNHCRENAENGGYHSVQSVEQYYHED